MPDYELVDETNGLRYGHIFWRICALILCYVLITTVVYFTWNATYSDNLLYPLHLADVPDAWYRRAHIYANSFHPPTKISHDFRILPKHNGGKNLNKTALKNAEDFAVAATEQNAVDATATQHQHNSRNGTHAAHNGTSTHQRLVCYYVAPIDDNDEYDKLFITHVPGNLCTHINIGMAVIRNCTLYVSPEVVQALRHVPELRSENPQLKVLLWVGGGDTSYGFADVVRNHANRKRFIQSIKQVLQQFAIDGIDLDWEFPSAYNKERQHFSQLLYEIRQEYKRERRNYLLSVAVAAPDGIAYFAYDVREINLYVDYVNLMTYDYHFFTRWTPFTGINAPLFARRNELSLLGTLNINYSVNWWLANGLERSKLVVGLPTYGHSFTLVNPFNNGIAAPASGMGRCGSKGFVAFSEVCTFETHNLFISVLYDQQSCSPYLYSGTEWISFDNEMSLECKARYIRSNDLGGAMIFSLNTDDFAGYCAMESRSVGTAPQMPLNSNKFPLVETVRRILFQECSNWTA